MVASKADAELLLVRLGIDGFHCGKRKVFLKYYHLDFLTQVTYPHTATQYLHNVFTYPSSTRTSTRRSCGCRRRPGGSSPGSGRSGRGGHRRSGRDEDQPRDVAGAAAWPPRCWWPGRWPGGGDTTRWGPASQVQRSQGPPPRPRWRTVGPAWRSSTGPPRTSSGTSAATTCASCWTPAPGELHLHLSPAPVSCTSPAQVPAAERAEVPPAGQEGGGRQPPAGQHREHGGGGGAGGNTSAHALGLVTIT